MYKWNSEFLRDFSQGIIVVVAESVEEARRKVLAEFDKNRDTSSCEYESERLELIEDLKDEPKELEVLFIKGSQ
jgi:hypothetical protein